MRTILALFALLGGLVAVMPMAAADSGYCTFTDWAIDDDYPENGVYPIYNKNDALQVIGIVIVVNPVWVWVEVGPRECIPP